MPECTASDRRIPKQNHSDEGSEVEANILRRQADRNEFAGKASGDGLDQIRAHDTDSNEDANSNGNDADNSAESNGNNADNNEYEYQHGTTMSDIEESGESEVSNLSDQMSLVGLGIENSGTSEQPGTSAAEEEHNSDAVEEAELQESRSQAQVQQGPQEDLYSAD
jgi:hypothetical protein